MNTKSNAHLAFLMRKLGFKTLATALTHNSMYEIPNKVFKDNGEGVSSSDDDDGSSSSFHTQKRY